LPARLRQAPLGKSLKKTEQEGCKSITNFSRRAQESRVKIDLGRARVHGTPSSGQTCVGDNLKAKLGSLGRSRYCPRHLGSGFPPRKAIPNKRVHLMLGQFVEKEQALLNDVRNMKSEKVSSSQ